MSAPRARSSKLHLLLGSALLAGLASLAVSCVQALGVDGYVDTYAATCELALRCYGEAFTGCDERVKKIDLLGQEAEWLEKVRDDGCLSGCDTLYKCLDYQPICVARDGSTGAATGVGGSTGETSEGAGEGTKGVTAACALDAQCCGFADGLSVCRDDACCSPLGVHCDSDSDCCADIGFCSDKTETCGGVTCAPAGADCLNAFQCCSGRCTDGACEEKPCPQEGFACETDADCCDLLCNPDTLRCFDPACSQQGEPCLTADDCCDEGFKCFDQGGVGGVCSPEDCSPNNVDCLYDEQCCTGHCIEGYRLCGECVDTGATCSAGIACCSGNICNEDGLCEVCAEQGEGCKTSECCFGLTCNGQDVCVPDPNL